VSKGIDPDAWIAEMRAKGHDVTASGPPVETPAPIAKRPPVVTTAPRRVVVEVDVPIRTASEANVRGKRRDKMSRNKAVKEAVRAALARALPVPLPCRVIVTRFGQRELDSDNLPRALKAVRDVVASWLGVDDADKRVKWRVRQRAGWIQKVRIRIEHTEATA
jgi:hypothetical protein